MRQVQNKKIIEILSEEVRVTGLEVVASKIDKAPSTLYAELNPYADQSRGKLSLDDALEIMKITQKITILEMAANIFGHKLLPIKANPDGENKHHESLQMLEAANDLSKAAINGDDRRTLVSLHAKLLKEADDVLQRALDDKKR